MSDMLSALEARGDELEAFATCREQANAYIADKGTQPLVDELRASSRYLSGYAAFEIARGAISDD